MISDTLKRRPGRPSLPAGEVKTAGIHCKVTAAVKDQLFALAQKQHDTVSNLVAGLIESKLNEVERDG